MLYVQYILIFEGDKYLLYSRLNHRPRDLILIKDCHGTVSVPEYDHLLDPQERTLNSYFDSVKKIC